MNIAATSESGYSTLPLSLLDESSTNPDSLADNKLTGFAVHLALAGHRDIPRQNEHDFLSKAQTASTANGSARLRAVQKAKKGAVKVSRKRAA